MTEPEPPARPLVVVLSGPSGAGKDAVMGRLRERGLPVVVPATMTTRAPRDGEVEGVHHRFVTRAAFERHLAAGDLLEHAEVYGNLYGVPRDGVRRALASARHVLIRVDVQGARSLRHVIPGALYLFVVPESLETLDRRLRARRSEDEATLRLRLDEARAELAAAPLFDHVITNREGDLDAAADAAWAAIERAARDPSRPAVEV